MKQHTEVKKNETDNFSMPTHRWNNPYASVYHLNQDRASLQLTMKKNINEGNSGHVLRISVKKISGGGRRLHKSYG